MSQKKIAYLHYHIHLEAVTNHHPSLNYKPFSCLFLGNSVFKIFPSWITSVSLGQILLLPVIPTCESDKHGHHFHDGGMHIDGKEISRWISRRITA